MFEDADFAFDFLCPNTGRSGWVTAGWFTPENEKPFFKMVINFNGEPPIFIDGDKTMELLIRVYESRPEGYWVKA